MSLFASIYLPFPRAAYRRLGTYLHAQLRALEAALSDARVPDPSTLPLRSRVPELASSTACRREPDPEVLPLVTVNLFAPATTGIAKHVAGAASAMVLRVSFLAAT
jgi:hypothetical protein